MNEKDGISVLKEIKEVFDRNNLTFWLECGTLLGAYRDGTFIKDDHDIDIGMWLEDSKKINLCCDELKEKGFDVYYGTPGYVMKDNSVPHGLWKKGCPVGFFLYYKNKEKNFTYEILIPLHKFGQFIDYIIWFLDLRRPEVKKRDKSKVPLVVSKFLSNLCRFIPFFIRIKMINALQIFYKKTDCIHIETSIPCKYFKKMVDFKFYEVNFKIPYKTEEYFERRYGKDWKTPLKIFDGSKVITRKYKYGGKEYKNKKFIQNYSEKCFEY